MFSWWRECRDWSLISYWESVPSLVPRSDEQKVVSMEAVVGGAGANEEKDQEEECVCFSENSISINIFISFLDYRPLRGNDCVVKRSIMQLASLATWVTTVLTCLGYREKLCGH